MVTVIGICSSPRKGGNSEIILDKALEGARAAGALVEKMILNGLDFRPCQECGGCDRTGRCVLPDGMQTVFKKIEELDGLIIASPIFFASLSAQAKMMIDRFHCAWIRKYILKEHPLSRKIQKGVFLCVSAQERDDFFGNAKKIIRTLFATLDVEYLGDLYCGGIEEEGDMLKKAECLKEAERLGRRLAESLQGHG